MLPSKYYYMIAGADLTFALVCAVIHDPRVFLFVGLGYLTNWVGDKVREEELKKVPDEKA